jgi:hypothetical protein
LQIANLLHYSLPEFLYRRYIRLNPAGQGIFISVERFCVKEKISLYFEPFMGRCIMDQVTRIPLNPGPENMLASAVFEASDIRKAG